MALFTLAYDLNNQKNYPRITGELERLNCHKAQRSYWLGSFDETAQEVLDHFKRFIDEDDSLLVAKITKSEFKRFKALAGTNDWLKQNS